jgi:hypothetical protein
MDQDEHSVKTKFDNRISANPQSDFDLPMRVSEPFAARISNFDFRLSKYEDRY